MMRIFINGYEFEYSNKLNLNSGTDNIKFIFDDGTVYTGTIYGSGNSHISIKFSNWEKKNSRICLEFFKRFGIDLNLESGVEKMTVNREDVVIPYPPAFPYFKVNKGLLTSMLKMLLNIEKSKGTRPKTDLEKDVAQYCEKYCLLDCNKSCPLNKYVGKKSN